jgi:protein SCO1/2
MPRFSAVVWIVCALALAALLVFVGPKRLLTPPEGSESAAHIGGVFTLSNTEGTPVSASDFRGKYMLVYFGFTHCPDICPTTLLVMKNALAALGEKQKAIVPIFISLDPARDTPRVMKQYVSNFGPRLVGLTGTAEEVKKAADAYRVYFSRVEQPDSASGYLIDHSGFMYLMDPNGRYLAHFSHTIPEGELAQKLNQFVP